MRNFSLAILLGTIMLGTTPDNGAAAASTGYGFGLDVTLSTKAAAKLAALGEKIEVGVYWLGEPAKNAPKKEIVQGQIELGDDRVQIPGASGHATLTDQKFLPAKLKWVKGPVQVLINIYTARLKNPDNLLSCDTFEDDIAKLQAAPVTLKCKLIYGDD